MGETSSYVDRAGSIALGNVLRKFPLAQGQMAKTNMKGGKATSNWERAPELGLCGGRVSREPPIPSAGL